MEHLRQKPKSVESNNIRFLRNAAIAVALLGLINARSVYSNPPSEIEFKLMNASPILSSEVSEAQEYSFAKTHHLDLAWEAGYQGEGSLIVVIDNGRKRAHNVNLAGEACISTTTENGSYQSDCLNGQDFDDSFGAAIDDTAANDGHGHYMMHIAGSRGSEGKFAGAAPEAEIYPIKISSRDGSGGKAILLDSLEKAILYTPTLKERFPDKEILMSVSLEMTSSSNQCDSQFQGLFDAIEAAREQGIPFVGSSRPMTFPGCLSNTEAVAPTDLKGENLLQYHPTASSLAAVGDEVCVDIGGSEHDCFRGASVSTALTAGMLGLVSTATDIKSPGDLSTRLYDNSWRMPGSSAYLIDALAAITDSRPYQSSGVNTTYLPFIINR